MCTRKETNPKPTGSIALWQSFCSWKAGLVLLTILLLGTSGLQAQNPQAEERVPVLIAFRQNPGPNEQALVRAFGGFIKYTYHLVPAIAATLPQAAIQALQNNPNVVSVELDGTVQAIDAELDNTWGVAHIGAGIVHDGGYKGYGVKVAVIDSGIDYTHPDLIGNYRGGFDFVNNDNNPMDDYWHGTHVAGTIAAADNDDGVVGVAHEADLYALKALDASGSGAWSDIIAALQWAVVNGIQVTNNSYGSSRNPGGTVQAAFDNSAAAGIIHVAAAGNEGNPKGKGNNVGYPARYDSVIAVAATDSNNNRASFSSTGDTVELAAPGVDIASTVPLSLEGFEGYGIADGTSMASPHVAGTVALMIAAGITDVRTQLQTTADDLGESGLDPLYGFGLVDADEAAAPSGPVNNAPAVSITSPANGFTFDSGTSILFEGSASDTEDGDLTASLAWTSSIDGPIGAGGSYWTTLSDGNHMITAEVTDSGGATRSASISITVGNPPAEATTVSVASITYATEGGRNSDKHLLTTVALDPPVSGASVSITLNHSSGSSWIGTALTGGSGTVTWTLKNARSGDYTTTVDNVSADGLTWDGVTPANGFNK